MRTERPFLSFGEWLKERFGRPVRKVSVDAGFTCPNRDGFKGRGGCIYCDNLAFSPKLEGSITAQLDAQLAKMRRKPEGIIVYFQPFTNTYGPVARLRELWEEAVSYGVCAGTRPEVAGLAVGTRPDCLPDDVLELAADFAKRTMFWLEIGVQTAKERTLLSINRGHGWREWAGALERVAKFPDILVCVHLIIGLPGETREDVRRTAELVAEFRPAGVKLHHLHVVEGTRLHQLYEQGLVKMLEAGEYASLAADVIERLPPGTVIQRLMGEVRGARLVAPKWSKSKNEITEMIENELLRRIFR